MRGAPAPCVDHLTGHCLYATPALLCSQHRPWPTSSTPPPPFSSRLSSDGEAYSSDSSGDEEGAADPAAQTAWEVGLNGADLVPDEAGLLPPGADVAAYVRVRQWGGAPCLCALRLNTSAEARKGGRGGVLQWSRCGGLPSSRPAARPPNTMA